MPNPLALTNLKIHFNSALIPSSAVFVVPKEICDWSKVYLDKTDCLLLKFKGAYSLRSSAIIRKNWLVFAYLPFLWQFLSLALFIELMLLILFFEAPHSLIQQPISLPTCLFIFFSFFPTFFPFLLSFIYQSINQSTLSLSLYRISLSRGLLPRRRREFTGGQGGTGSPFSPASQGNHRISTTPNPSVNPNNPNNPSNSNNPNGAANSRRGA